MVENADRLRWLAFVGAAVAAILLLMFLPPPASSVVLIVVVALGMHAAVRYIGTTWHRLTVQVVARTRAFMLDCWLIFLGRETDTRRYQTVLLMACSAAAVVLMVISAVNFRANAVDAQVNFAAVSMLVGGVALGAALWVARKDPDRLLPLPTVAERASSGVRVNRLLIALSVVAFAVIVEMNTLWLPVEWLTGVSYHIQFALFMMALLLLGAGFSGFRLSGIRQYGRSIRQTLATINLPVAVLLLGITALAAVLRFWQLGQITRFEVDELQSMVAVNRLTGQLDVPILTVIKPLHWNYAWFFPYVQTAFVNLIGHNWTGLRVIGAFFGTLTIPLQYALARAWFDRKTALMAALLLAVFPPFVHFSRLSLINIADPLIGTLIFTCLSWGVRTNRRIWFVLGGLVLGMSQYFYEGGRLLYPALAVIWLLALAIFWRRRLNWRDALTTVVIALLVALPFYLTLEAKGEPFGERLSDNFIGWAYFSQPGSPVLQHMIRPFLTFIHLPDASPSYMYYGGSQSLLLWYMVAPFLLGCFYMLWRLFKPGMLLLALWLLLAMLGNVLVRDNAMVVRYLTVFPVLTLLAAVGIRYCIPLFWPRNKHYATLAMVLLVGIFSVGQVDYYFGEHLPQYEIAARRFRPGYDLDDAVLRASYLPQGTRVHIITDWADVDTYYKSQVSWTSRYFLGEESSSVVRVLGQNDFTLEYVLRLNHRLNQAFFVIPGDDAILSKIRAEFTLSAGIPTPYADVPPDEQFVLYFVPAS